MGFSSDDVKFFDEFGAFLHLNAKFKDLDIEGAIKLNNLLIAYNKLRKKVSDHILEDVKVTPAPVPPPPEPKAKAK